MGRRRAGTGAETIPSTIKADGSNGAEAAEDEGEGEEKGIAKLFEGGKWDSGKMVRSFARVGAVSKKDVFASHEGVSFPRSSPNSSFSISVVRKYQD